MSENKFKSHISNPNREVQIHFLRKLKSNKNYKPKSLKIFEDFFTCLDDFSRMEFYLTHYHYGRSSIDGFGSFLNALKLERNRENQEALSFIISEKISNNYEDEDVHESLEDLCKISKVLYPESKRNICFGLGFVKTGKRCHIKFLKDQEKSNIIELRKSAQRSLERLRE